MTIKIKLLCSFLSIIFLTIILGLVSYSSISSLSNELVPALQANEKIYSDMLKLRKNEKDFLRRSVKNPVFFSLGTSKYLDKFEKNYISLKKELKIVKKFSSHTSSHKNIDKIEGLVDIYRNKFLIVVKATKEKGFKDWGEVGKLRAAAHNIEKKLSSVGLQNELMINMLLNRRHEKDYLLRNDLKYQEKLSQRVTEFKTLLADSDIISSDKKELLELINDYKIKFDSLVAIDEKIGRTTTTGLIGDYRQAIHQLEPLLKEEEKQFNNEVASVVQSNVIVLLVSIAIMVLFGLFLTLYLSSLISKPLREMAEAGKKVSSGDLSAELPDVKTKDEIKDIHTTMTSLVGALRYLKSR